MKTVSKLLALATIFALFSMPAVQAVGADDDDQPHMEAALKALREAKAHLEMAKHDKGGHRAAAVRATNEAIRHTEMGIKAGERHEEHHDKK
jgi:acetyl esterase/lipase